jgi:hypothetical protein
VVRHILIRAGKVTIRARLLATPTADRIWNALPISGPAQTWGKEVYFRTPISHDIEPDARLVVSKGEIAFWPDGDAITIGFGATPISKRGEIRFTSKCNVWAVAIDDVDQLKHVYPGEQVSITEAHIIGDKARPAGGKIRDTHIPSHNVLCGAALCPAVDESGTSG